MHAQLPACMRSYRHACAVTDMHAQLPTCMRSYLHACAVTCMYALVLLDMRQLLEGLVAERARISAHVRVHERVLRELLRGGEGLHAPRTLVALLFRVVYVLGVSLHL